MEMPSAALYRLFVFGYVSSTWSEDFHSSMSERSPPVPETQWLWKHYRVQIFTVKTSRCFLLMTTRLQIVGWYGEDFGIISTEAPSERVYETSNRKRVFCMPTESFFAGAARHGTVSVVREY